MAHPLLLMLVSMAALFSCGDANLDELRFLIIGDWGGWPVSPYSTQVERAVAKEMGKVAETMKTQFTVALGEHGNMFVLNLETPASDFTPESFFSTPSSLGRMVFSFTNLHIESHLAINRTKQNQKRSKYNSLI